MGMSNTAFDSGPSGGTPIYLTPVEIARFGIVGERFTSEEVDTVIDLAGLRPVSMRSNGAPAYDPVAVREAFEDLAACDEHGLYSGPVTRIYGGWFTSCQ